MTAEFRFTDASVPARYDEFLVPRLFGPWAVGLIETVGVRPGQRLLDVATGPGTVAREAARAVGSAGRVVAGDGSPTMIERAGAKPPVAGGATIEYRVSPAAPLDVPDRSFDVVTCQQGLQFFPDRGAALAEMKRAIVPNGSLAVAIWLPIERCALFHALADRLTAAGAPELGQLMRIPFPTFDGGELESWIAAAGFRSVRVVTEERELVFPGGVSEALIALSGTPIGPYLAALASDIQSRIVEVAAKRFEPLAKGRAVAGPMASWIATAVG